MYFEYENRSHLMRLLLVKDHKILGVPINILYKSNLISKI